MNEARSRRAQWALPTCVVYVHIYIYIYTHIRKYTSILMFISVYIFKGGAAT